MGKHRNKGQSYRLSVDRQAQVQAQAELIIAKEQDPTWWGGVVVGESTEGGNVYQLFDQTLVLLIEDKGAWYFDIQSIGGENTGFEWKGTAKTGIEDIRNYLIEVGELMA